MVIKYYSFQKTPSVVIEQLNQDEKDSSQDPETPQITLLDDDEEEDDDVPLAKLSRTSKQNVRKGRNMSSHKSMSQPPTNEGISSNPGRGGPARKAGKTIKQE